MAEENTRLPRELDQGFVGRLVPDPASPPELTLLVGYPGASVEEGHVRLYASPDLSRWWEIPEDGVLHRQTVPNDPLGAEIVWIRRDKQPVLNSRRSDSDMNTTYTIPSYLPCITTTPVGAAAAVPPAQPVPLTLHCSLLCPTSHLVCLPSMGCPPHTGAQLGAAGPVQHQPHTISGVNCPTSLPQTISDFNCGTGPARIPPTQICTTTPVGAAAPHLTFFGCTVPPVTTGCTYGGAQGHLPPHTYITAAVPPHTHEAQAQPQQTWVWPPTYDAYCGTSPVAQGAQAPQAPQQTYVLPTAGNYPTIPPVTVCCYR